MSAKKEREKRRLREERLQVKGDAKSREPRRIEEDTEDRERRQRMVKLASATAFVAIAVLLVLIVISQLNTDGGDTDLEGVAEVRAELKGLDQNGLILGRPEAHVTLIEFGDLKCPACKFAAENIVPEVIDSRVRSGEAKIEFRNYTILGDESVSAGAAAIAAGKQGHGWNFIELFYRNQGYETSDYVTDAFLTEVARGAGVPDIKRWNAERKSKLVLKEIYKTTALAEKLDFGSTPSFAAERSASRDNYIWFLRSPPDSATDIEDLIERAREESVEGRESSAG